MWRFFDWSEMFQTFDREEGEGEKCQWHFARKPSLESCAFKDEVLGPLKAGESFIPDPVTSNFLTSCY
jgi:hypothetical protein